MPGSTQMSGSAQMPGSTDPLGRRALFWAPAEHGEDGARPVASEELRGRHALFSIPEERARRGLQILLDCSRCGTRTPVDVFEYLLLHLPVFVWRPGRGYTRLMTCPACRKRTWISASLPSRST
jgi:hypothetical protein